VFVLPSPADRVLGCEPLKTPVGGRPGVGKFVGCAVVPSADKRRELTEQIIRRNSVPGNRLELGANGSLCGGAAAVPCFRFRPLATALASSCDERGQGSRGGIERTAQLCGPSCESSAASLRSVPWTPVTPGFFRLSGRKENLSLARNRLSRRLQSPESNANSSTSVRERTQSSRTWPVRAPGYLLPRQSVTGRGFPAGRRPART